jgi:outer membrane receptor protein involved in Fe transport
LLEYKIKKFWNGYIELYGTVHNLFDQAPPIDPFNFLTAFATYPILYDELGRTMSVGARFKY